jgi:hypothetical protein
MADLSQAFAGTTPAKKTAAIVMTIMILRISRENEKPRQYFTNVILGF